MVLKWFEDGDCVGLSSSFGFGAKVLVSVKRLFPSMLWSFLGAVAALVGDVVAATSAVSSSFAGLVPAAQWFNV